jgi:AraC-like DNA-binding protein
LLQRIRDTEQQRFIDGAPSSSLLGQLEQILESSLGWSAIGLQTAASIVGTSPRTLQRRLAEEGVDFSRLLQSIRFRSAQRLLRDPELPLAEISRRLSYAVLRVPSE